MVQCGRTALLQSGALDSTKRAIIGGYKSVPSPSPYLSWMPPGYLWGIQAEYTQRRPCCRSVVHSIELVQEKKKRKLKREIDGVVLTAGYAGPVETAFKARAAPPSKYPLSLSCCCLRGSARAAFWVRKRHERS